jgi:endonuclease G
MSTKRTLNNQLRTELIGILCSYPPLQTRDGREAWLLHLSPSVRDLIIRRHDNCRIDLAFIIDAIQSQQLSDGSRPLLTLIDAVLSETEDLAVGQELEALRRIIERLFQPTEISPNDIGDLSPGLDSQPSFEEVVIGEDEKVLVGFLRNALKASRAVARIMVPRTIGGRVFGTGWLIAPGLLLTCYHVIEARRKDQGEPSATPQELEQQARGAVLWFGYDIGAYTEYRCIDLVHADVALDYALLRVAETSIDNVPLSDWGILEVVRIPTDLARGTRLNVVQHPGGRVKEIALRTNFYIGSVTASSRFHYLSDTEKGSSGSPVLDDNWQVVGLHRASDDYARYYKEQPLRFNSLGLQYATPSRFSDQAVAAINEGVSIHAVLDNLPGVVRGEIERAQGRS